MDEGVRDPHKNQESFQNWNKKNLINVLEVDRPVIEAYISDMEKGRNIYNKKKGGRSFARLNAIKVRIPTIATWCKIHYNKPLIEFTDDDAIDMFNKLKKGEIKKKDGGVYKSVGDFIKDFAAFWHWYMRSQEREFTKSGGKKGSVIPDITQDIEQPDEHEPKFIYLNFEQFKQLYGIAKEPYKTIMMFLFDTGLRAPKELLNIKVSDIEPIPNSDKANLNIRREIGKTKYPRKIKLMMSYPDLKSYIKTNKRQKDDFIFNITPMKANRYLSRLAFKILGVGTPKEITEKYLLYGRPIEKKIIIHSEGLTLYDFRHISACYWLPKYPTQVGLMYRFGWKNVKMIEYYSRYMGFKDAINDEDLLDSAGKTILQKDFEIEKNKREILEEQVSAQNRNMIKQQQEMRELQLKKDTDVINLRNEMTEIKKWMQEKQQIKADYEMAIENKKNLKDELIKILNNIPEKDREEVKAIIKATDVLSDHYNKEKTKAESVIDKEILKRIN